MREVPTVRFVSNAFDGDKVQVRKVEGRETISQLFEFEVHIVCTDSGGLDVEELMSQPVALVFERQGRDAEERRISGIVASLRDRVLTEAHHHEYVLKVVPRAWQATLTVTNDIYMDMSVPEIIQKKLEGAGLDPGRDIEMRLLGKYEKREFVVQYRESDLAFISRLAEDLGIFFYFEHAAGHDVIVFSDNNDEFKDAEPARAPFAARGDQMNVYEIEATRRLVTKAVKARDYNYRNPSMDLLGEASLPVLGSGVMDEFGAHVKTPAEANQIAKVRAEEIGSAHLTYEGKGELPGFRAGSIVTIEGHASGDLELVLVEVRHTIAQPAMGAGNDGHAYTNTFRAIPRKVPFRPPRVTPKPTVPGVLTGIVESPAKTDFGAIDDEGRYRVAFMYDSTTDRNEGKASRPLRMAQPSAGNDRGFHIPLKPGTEVIITCVNGDPDRPIIAGAVPNPQTASPVTSKNAEKSMWNTNANSIAIDDRDPRCKISVNGTDHVFQIGQPNAPEVGFAMATVGNISSATNGTLTSMSNLATSYSEWKASTAGSNTLAVAGIPNPFSIWKKIEVVIASVVTLAKTVGNITEQVRKVEDLRAAQRKKKAEEQKKVADAQNARAHKAMLTALGEKYPETAIKVQNPDGSMRLETEEEFQKRVFEQYRDSFPGWLKNDFGYLNDRAAEAAKAVKDEAEAEEKRVKAWDEAWWDPSQGTAKTIVDSVEASVAAIKSGEKLWSTLSDIWSKQVVHKAHYVTMRTLQAGAGCSASASAPRADATIGTFDEHYNIQGATNSMGLLGLKNTFVAGVTTATLYSPDQTAVIGGYSVHVKSPQAVEVSSGNNLKITAKNMVDVHSSDKMKLVAHAGEKSLAIPGGFTMVLHSKEGIKIESTDKDIDAKARKNIKLEAVDESIEFKAKKTFKVDAEDQDVLLDAKNGTAALHGKTKLYVGAGGGSGFGVVAESGKMMAGQLSSANDLKGASVKDDASVSVSTGEVKARMKDCKVSITGGEIASKAGGTTITLKKDGNVSVKGSKVLLL